jgi:hypothetical protein
MLKKITIKLIKQIFKRDCKTFCKQCNYGYKNYNDVCECYLLKLIDILEIRYF